MCVSACELCTHTCRHHTSGGIHSPRDGITLSCEPPDMGPPEVQQTLTAELPSPPLIIF